MVEMCVVDEAGRPLAINQFIKMTMTNGVGAIHLVTRPCTRYHELEDDVDHDRFYNQRKGVSQVNAGLHAA